MRGGGREGQLFYLILSNGITREREVGPRESDPFGGCASCPESLVPPHFGHLGWVWVSEGKKQGMIDKLTRRQKALMGYILGLGREGGGRGSQ